MPECSNLGIHFYFVAMKKCIKISRLFLVSLFCLALSVKGISQNTNERGVIRKSDTTIVRGATYAIIIGISNYKNVTPLQYADRDAQAFESFLLSDAGGKVPTVNIETFLNDKGHKDIRGGCYF